MFFGFVKTTFRVGNVFFLFAILLIAFSLYNANPDGVYYDIQSNSSVEYKFYMTEGQDLDMGATVVNVNYYEFDLEQYYAEELLDMQLYHQVSGVDELVYSGKSAAWSRSYQASEGYYRLVLTNLSDDKLGVVVGRASLTVNTVLSLVAGSVFLALSFALSAITFSILITAGVFYLMFLPLREYHRQERARTARLYQQMSMKN